MKYSPLSSKKENILRIPMPDKGINTSELIGEIADNQAFFAKNIIFENGCIKTRQGLKNELEDILDVSDYLPADNVEYRITDTEYTYEGKKGRIAVADIRYDDTLYINSMFLVFSDCSVKPIGQIFYNRVDSDIFYLPKYILFFVGAPTRGAGIYAFVCLTNEGDPTESEYAIYEVGTDYNKWEMCTSYYIPTIYVNGRGNLYEEARALNQAYTGTPKTLETLNILQGVFYAYYSSDGLSYSFRMPYSDLADKAVVCRIYYNTENYSEWVVYSGKNSSAEVSFMGQKVIMNVNRLTGTVNFTCEEKNYPIPVMPLYKENNMRFQAVKETEQNYNDIVSCKFIVSHSNRLFFAGGNKKNKIYSADNSNPLYFPECYNNDIGSSDGNIKALCSVGDRLLAFKEGEIYSVSINEGKYLNKISLLSDNSKYFKDIGSFVIKRIVSDVRCSIRGGLRSLGNFPIWQGNDYKIYTLSGDKIKLVSKEIDSLIKELFADKNNSFEVSGNNYILMNRNNAVIIDLTDDKNSAYYWEFPKKIKIIGAVSGGENTAFIINCDGEDICRSAYLKGNDDIITLPETQTESFPIETEFVSKQFLAENHVKKHIKRAELTLRSMGDAKLCIGDYNCFEEFDLSEKGICSEDDICHSIIADIYGAKAIGIRLKAKGNITLGSAVIYYNCIG